MAINFTLKRQNGSSQDVLYPKTTWAQVVNKPATYTPTAHNHDASNITSGVIAPARLGTGTPSVSTFLRGDGAWSVVDTGVTNPFILGSCDTAAGTAAKVVTLTDPNYIPKADDVFVITFTNGNSVSNPTLNINGTGAKNIRLGTTNASTTTFTVGAGAQVLLLFDGTYFNLTGSYRTSDSNSHDRTQLSAIQVGTTVQRYKLLMEGVDGKYYPLTLENSTGLTKTVSTADFKVGGNIVYYNSTTVLAPDATTTSCYSEIPTAYAGYTFNKLSGYQAHRPIYLKGTIVNGVFKLDNSSYTSWFTQDLPTSEDGFVYIYVGFMYSTNDDLRLMQYHPMYEFKDKSPATVVDITYYEVNRFVELEFLPGLMVGDYAYVIETDTMHKCIQTAPTGNLWMEVDMMHTEFSEGVVYRVSGSTYKYYMWVSGYRLTDVTNEYQGRVRLYVPEHTHSDYALRSELPTIPSITVSNGAAETGKYIKSISASGHTITVVKDTLPSGGGGTEEKIFKAECSTAAGTSTKVITLDDPSYTPKVNDLFLIKFTNGISTSYLYLNINNTGTKTVYNEGVSFYSNSFVVNAGGYVLFMYDGSYYHTVGHYTGVLPVKRGGTGLGSVVSNYGGVLIKRAEDTDKFTMLTGSANQFLRWNGQTLNPEFKYIFELITTTSASQHSFTAYYDVSNYRWVIIEGWMSGSTYVKRMTIWVDLNDSYQFSTSTTERSIKILWNNDSGTWSDNVVIGRSGSSIRWKNSAGNGPWRYRLIGVR